METVQKHLEKVRAERKAREKARIEKLREMNMKKYSSGESMELKPVKNISAMKSNSQPAGVKNRCANSTPRRYGSSLPKNQKYTNSQLSHIKNSRSFTSNVKMSMPSGAALTTCSSSTSGASAPRASGLPGPSRDNNRESVFERLYKPKLQIKSQTYQSVKPQIQGNGKKKSENSSNAAFNKRFTTFDHRTKEHLPIRRSISAVHLKRINKSELSNCIHKYASINDHLDCVHIKDINEDENLNQNTVISAVKSERKRVQFITPMYQKNNTPCPEDMQHMLKSWLQKRGKSFDSYRHLQCFGVSHMAERVRHLDLECAPRLEFTDDENKENIAVESDSDDESYMENMNLDNKLKAFKDWRKVASVCDSVELNETSDTTLTSADAPSDTSETLYGALNDLRDILNEGFEWEQCARWLRAIREQFPSAVESAPYWECRAALEERRGDLPASMKCWEEAIVKGTERSVAEASLEQLLDKLMQLKISPKSGQRRQTDPKMVNFKNVFKSSIIRFAVQKRNIRCSNQDSANCTVVTPVRRSGRLSTNKKRTPFKDCPAFKHYPQEATTVKELEETLGCSMRFIPNDKLHGTP